METEKQSTLGEAADNYEPMKLLTVADLEFITTDMPIAENAEADYPYKYVIVDKKEYKIPNIVIATIKDMREMSPDLTKFKVKKSGEGKKTKYTVIPIQNV